MRRAVRDRSTGERKFSERKRVVTKSKSGKDIMNYFRSENISRLLRFDIERGVKQCYLFHAKKSKKIL